MKIIAICSWFDESPEFLTEMVRSLDGVADHLVAVDGCYELWPRSAERFLSPPEQAEAIKRTAAEIGLDLTLHLPDGPWMDNEVEKRSFCFSLAETIADSDKDWYLIMDSDEYVAEVKDGWREKLAGTPHFAAEIWLLTRGGEPKSEPLRCFFRAIPNLHVEDAHYVFVGDINGLPHHVWGNSSVHCVLPALDLMNDVYLVHRRAQRTLGRNRDAESWYERRDREGHEWAAWG